MDDFKSAERRSNRIQIRLSTPELNYIKIKAKAKGFDSVSHLLRFSALKGDIVIETKIIETNKLVKEILEIIKNQEK